MDVSTAVDDLFSGAVPERIDELRSIWGEQEERVRLLDVQRFLLQQLYGTIQVSEIALRQIWLAGYASWRAIQAYNDVLTLSSIYAAELDLTGWKSLPLQAEKDAAFDEIFDKIKELDDLGTLEGFEWPAEIPYPENGLKITDPEMKATFDLVCMAGAYVFAHEVRHSMFERSCDRPDDIIDEERACDKWALSLMLEGADAYATANGWKPADVRAKRILGIIIGHMTILTLTPRRSWDASTDHPPVRERLRLVLDAVEEPVPDWFWTTVTSILLAFSRRLGVVVGPRPIPPSLQDLSYELCDLLRSN